MEKMKKGASAVTPTPKKVNTFNYNRLSNVCLLLGLASIIIMIIGYLRSNNTIVVLGMGIGASAITVQFALDPIEEE